MNQPYPPKGGPVPIQKQIKGSSRPGPASEAHWAGCAACQREIAPHRGRHTLSGAMSPQEWVPGRWRMPPTVAWPDCWDLPPRERRKHSRDRRPCRTLAIPPHLPTASRSSRPPVPSRTPAQNKPAGRPRLVPGETPSGLRQSATCRKNREIFPDCQVVAGQYRPPARGVPPH